MSCEACRLALEADGAKVDNINAALTQPCGCENFSVSPLSPGKVKDHERLHFLVPTPEGLTADGFLNPLLLVQVDRNGLSVLRENAANTEFELTAEELRPRWQTREKSLDGIMTFPVSAVRWLEGNRLCCVYDTALPGKPHHSDLMTPSLEPGLSRSERERRQKQRIKRIVDQIGKNFESITTFRNSTLAHLASAS